MKNVESLKPVKPYMLRRWKFGDDQNFYTCARPGRTGNPVSKSAKISDETVHRWILGLPKPKAAIISLLGRKPDGTSEFSFYSFYGGFDSPSDHPGGLSFKEWIARWHPNSSVLILEYPTVDFESIPLATLDAIAIDIRRVVSEGYSVIVMDSGGEQRSGAVRKHLGAIEDSATL